MEDMQVDGVRTSLLVKLLKDLADLNARFEALTMVMQRHGVPAAEIDEAVESCRKGAASRLEESLRTAGQVGLVGASEAAQKRSIQ